MAFRPASSRAEELLVYLRVAGKSGLTGAEMDRYMPRSSWRAALERLENTPGVLLTVERRPARPPRQRRAWVRAVLVGEFTPGEITPDAPEDVPDPVEPQQPTLFDSERAA